MEFTKDNVRAAAEKAAVQPGILHKLWEYAELLSRLDRGWTYFPLGGVQCKPEDVFRIIRQRFFVYVFLQKVFAEFGLAFSPEPGLGKWAWSCTKEKLRDTEENEGDPWEAVLEDVEGAPWVGFDIYEALGSRINIVDMELSGDWGALLCGTEEGLKIIDKTIRSFSEDLVSKAKDFGLSADLNDIDECSCIVFERSRVMMDFMKLSAPAGKEAMWSQLRSAVSHHKIGTWDDEKFILGNEEVLIASHCYYDEESLLGGVGELFIDAEGVFARFVILVIVCMEERGLL